jgi:Rrf2 family protein
VLKLSKKADYGLIALKHLAMHYGEESFSASDIAEAYGISTPLMAKVLQKLARGGLVAARHGSSGGYTLAREASSSPPA